MIHTNKMKLNVDDKLRLQLHYFSVRPKHRSSVNLFERTELVLAYQLEGAIKCMEEIYSSQINNVFIKHQGHITVEKLINSIDRGPSKEKTPIKFKFVEQNTKVKTEQKENNIKAYLFNIKYAKDQFKDILTLSDKKALDRVVNKIDEHLHLQDNKKPYGNTKKPATRRTVKKRKK